MFLEVVNESNEDDIFESSCEESRDNNMKPRDIQKSRDTCTLCTKGLVPTFRLNFDDIPEAVVMVTRDIPFVIGQKTIILPQASELPVDEDVLLQAVVRLLLLLLLLLLMMLLLLLLLFVYA